MLDQVWRFLREAPGDLSKDGHNVMLYEDDRPTVEVGVQVNGSFEPHGSVVPSMLPGGLVATATHTGPIDSSARRTTRCALGVLSTATRSRACAGRSTAIPIPRQATLPSMCSGRSLLSSAPDLCAHRGGAPGTVSVRCSSLTRSWYVS